MNADLTLKTKSLKLIYSDKEGSLRRGSTGEIVSSGTLSLGIQHGTYTDSQTGGPGKSHVIRLEHETVSLTTGKPVRQSTTLTHRSENDSVITDADRKALVDVLIQFLGPTTADASALNQRDAWLIVGEQ
jgi:hypothetical protein